MKYEHNFPFQSLIEKTDWGDEHTYWKPGCRIEHETCYHTGGSGERWFECDGIGKRILIEIKRLEMPGKFKDRVIFHKQYINPEGLRGPKYLEMCTDTMFEKKIRGFVTELLIYINDEEICL